MLRMLITEGINHVKSGVILSLTCMVCWSAERIKAEAHVTQIKGDLK